MKARRKQAVYSSVTWGKSGAIIVREPPARPSKGDIMRNLRAVFPAVAVVLLCVFAAFAAVVRPADASSTAPTAGASKVAGTVSARMVINRFRAVGKRVVGQGTVI